MWETQQNILMGDSNKKRLVPIEHRNLEYQQAWLGQRAKGGERDYFRGGNDREHL